MDLCLGLAGHEGAGLFGQLKHVGAARAIAETSAPD